MKCPRLPFLIFALMLLVSFAEAQIAAGGDFTIEKSVVAGGGAESSGGDFQARVTIGQARAGGPKVANPFDIYSGFWTPDAVPAPSGTCPFGQGYWKNNPGSWPVESLVLGDEVYTKAESLMILNTPVGNGKKSDASLIVAYQLIAAKLNVANGVDPTPLGTAISDADALLAPYNGRLPYQVMSKTAGGQYMVSLALLLESFNQGYLTPGCSPPM